MFTKSLFSLPRLPGVAKLQRLLLSAFAVSLLLGSSMPSFAWNGFAHESVAYIAYQRLTPQARVRANELLKLNPYYSRWEGNVPAEASPADKSMIIFIQAATWADQIKTDKSYTPDIIDTTGDRDLTLSAGTGSDKAFGPFEQNIGYGDKAMHKTWHFVDTPFSTDGTPLPQIPTPNAQTQIAELRGVLASNNSDDAKSYALSWILHLVGDVHQPLHASTRVSNTDPQGDHGGNKVKIRGSARELHAFWDSVLGKNAPPETVVEFARTLPAADERQAAKSDENEWVGESFQASKDYVYASPIEEGDGPYTLTNEYKTTATSIAKERVELAGARLANLLNNELK